jgi:D-3-phosphoglycerate dehydrogenase
MNVLVADKFEESGLKGLKALGVNVTFEPGLKDAPLGDRLAADPFDVLIVRGTAVDREMIEGSRLGLIVRAGAGYNTIDVEAASQQGVLVANCPGRNAQAVAELAMGLILACDRRIPDNVAELRAGRWDKARFSAGRGLYGRTLGLVGMGNISQQMIPRARAFGLNITGFSRWMTPETAAALGIGRSSSLEELAQHSDFVSVHLSLTPQTKGSIGAEFFSNMKPGAVFINTSRGEVVDQAAMLRALDERNLFAGLDVFDDEPTSGKGTYEGPLKNNPRAYCTHHIGASTEQAQEAIAEETVRIVREYLMTGMVPNVVNVRRGEQASHLLVVRHADRVGVLAHILDILKDEGVSVQEMENVVLGGAKAAIAQISVDKEPTADSVVRMKMNSSIFDVSVMAIQK